MHIFDSNVKGVRWGLGGGEWWRNCILACTIKRFSDANLIELQDSRFIDNAVSLSAHEHIYIQTVLTKGTG